MQGIIRNRPRPRLQIPETKQHVDFPNSPCIFGGTLTPDLPHSPPVFPSGDETEKAQGALKVQNYVLSNLLDSHGQTKVYKAFHIETHEEYICKVRERDVVS